MTDPSNATPSNNRTPPAAARPVVKFKRQTRVSWIWLVPLLVVLIGLSMIVKAWLHTGPTVTVSFQTAEGLEAGQTKLRYKDVVVGQVTDTDVAPDRKNILVDIELTPDNASYFTQEGTRYWVVRPRLGISGVTGLGTLLSGVYISVDGPVDHDQTEHDNEPVYKFTGLEKPPELTTGRSGTRYTLNASDLGSLDIGSPVYYRRVQVGRVIGYELNPNGTSVDIQIFVETPDDQFVTSDVRFWNSSGINFSLDADGLTVQTGSLAAVLAGGVSFESVNDANTRPAAADSVFELKESKAQALSDPDGPAFAIELHFQQSVRGLKVGAPVDFRGLELGKVVDIDLEFNPKVKRFYASVKADLYPMRFGPAYERLVGQDQNAIYPGNMLLAPLIKHGLRGQIRAANLLTGQQYVALDFFPDAAPVEDFRANRVPMLVPTVAGSFDRLQQQLSSIVSKLDKIPFEGLSGDLRASLQSVTKLLDGLNSQVTPEAMTTLKAAQRSLGKVNQLLASDSPLNENMERTMRELSGAAKALRDLADYLQMNPTALIHGRPADVLPPPSP